MTADLVTHYMGLRLRHPIAVAACPLVEDLDMLRRLEEAGAAAAVFPSLFEEQIEQQQMEVHALYEHGAESFAEAVSYFPDLDAYNLGPDDYLRRLEAARRAVSIPLIGSLNGVTSGGWIRYATMIQDTGVDALELNIYGVAADAKTTAGDVETRCLDLVAQVKQAIRIPLAVKLAPFDTAFAHLASRLVDLGADGLVIFNRFVHPDIDLEKLEVVPKLELSTSSELRLPLTWIALLRGRINASLAAGTGVHTPADALKLLLAGADITTMASALYLQGPGHIRTMVDGLRDWLDERGYDSVEQMKGSLSQEHCPDPAAFERAGYMRTLASWTNRAGK